MGKICSVDYASVPCITKEPLALAASAVALDLPDLFGTQNAGMISQVRVERRGEVGPTWVSDAHV